MAANGKRPRHRYTDEFRAGVVLQLMAAGYPDTPGALARVARKNKVPHQTAGRWARAANNPPPSNLVQHKKIDFVAAIEDEMTAILGEMGVTRQDASYSQLGTVFGILTDKRQLLTGGPTDNQNRQVLIKYAD